MPVGFTSTRTVDASRVSWARSSSTVLSTFSRMSGSSVFSRSISAACWVEMTTVSSRTGTLSS
ncbi:Uncharacterised protein [Mycobacterium tuberculosis]|nr:Uncharacterised protein [Mycobacterium tuberculosis]COZ20651.1 Uncharacterised protein [Mycobacterium tuberculosis]CPA32935.1 Uncharacterised protein [Mycobacterium tuberculosis]